MSIKIISAGLFKLFSVGIKIIFIGLLAFVSLIYLILIVGMIYLFFDDKIQAYRQRKKIEACNEKCKEIWKNRTALIESRCVVSEKDRNRIEAVAEKEHQEALDMWRDLQ